MNSTPLDGLCLSLLPMMEDEHNAGQPPCKIKADSKHVL